MSVEHVEDSALASVLTSRELEVALLVARGCSNKDVARKLDLTEGTVKTHMHNILRKVGAPSRNNLITSMNAQGE